MPKLRASPLEWPGRPPTGQAPSALFGHQREERGHLLTFLYLPEVPATKWQAEQTIPPRGGDPARSRAAVGQRAGRWTWSAISAPTPPPAFKR